MNKTYVALLLDESGSMSHLRGSTLAGANAWLRDQRAEAPRDLCTIATFDAAAGSVSAMNLRIKMPFQGVMLSEIPELGPQHYRPEGGTPLYDAIGRLIQTIENDPRSLECKVMIAVITDGQERDSQEYTRESIAAKITEKEAAGWTILYLGANQDAHAVAKGMGISADMVTNYAASAVGTATAYGATSNAMNLVRSGSSRATISSTLNTADTSKSL